MGKSRHLFGRRISDGNRDKFRRFVAITVTLAGLAWFFEFGVERDQSWELWTSFLVTMTGLIWLWIEARLDDEITPGGGHGVQLPSGPNGKLLHA